MSGGGFMKTIELTDEYMLKMLVKQANGFGATLQVRKHKKYPFVVCGHLPFYAWPVKMGGTAKWLYNELMNNLVRNDERNNKRWAARDLQ